MSDVTFTMYDAELAVDLASLTSTRIVTAPRAGMEPVEYVPALTAAVMFLVPR